MTQLLLIALLILLLFMGPTLLRRWRGVLSDRSGEEGDKGKSEKSKGRNAPAVQDLVACRKCGVYGPAPAPTCDRDDCPGRRG